MADRIILARATDSNFEIVAGAEANFYSVGTTSELEVYSDEAGTTPVAQPLTADANGVFAATFTNSPVKVVVKDPGGVTLPGYPSDPHPKVAASGSAASGISFSPTTENPATNVQDAIEELTTSPDFSNATNKATIRSDLGLGGLATLDILDEDDFASDSATRPPSQQSTKAYVDGLAVGVGQTWQNVIGSRSINTSYQNTTGRPIMVAVLGLASSGTDIEVSDDNSTWVSVGRFPATGSPFTSNSFIVPDDHYYRVSGSGVTLNAWGELR